MGKCFGNKLEELVKKGSKATDEKSMYQGKHRLGRKARHKLQQYFNNAVRKHIRPGIITSEQLEEAITAMRNAILASLYHCCLLEDDNVRHQYCPPTWCGFKRDGTPVPNEPH